MTKKTWIVWALFLLLPGAVGLGIHFTFKDSLYRRVDESAQRSAQNPVAKEYLQMYEQWSQLPADEKADNPWGHGTYGGVTIQKRLREGQSDRLWADLPTLERGFTHYPDELADVMYGTGWQQEVEGYRRERSVAEMILIGSTFLLAVGGLILTGGFVKQIITLVLKRGSEEEDEVTEEDPEDSETTTSESLQKSSLQNDSTESVKSASDRLLSGEKSETDQEDDSAKKGKKGYFQTSKKAAHQKSASTEDEENSIQLPTKPTASKPNISSKAKKDSYFGWAIDADDSATLDTLMTTEPLTKELTELTEEVSAIRQYAAQQQDQMRKLQDGYDWMIIRRFCLRIIRSIDNIDDRIINLNKEGQDVSIYLEDIRDELIFALESSGIEQFKPDLNVSFKGLEKYAEAVRERAFTEESDLVGCIAEVTRPGYQYLVNDEDIKIVRCAQVKLYEAN